MEFATTERGEPCVWIVSAVSLDDSRGSVLVAICASPRVAERYRDVVDQNMVGTVYEAKCTRIDDLVRQTDLRSPACRTALRQIVRDVEGTAMRYAESERGDPCVWVVWALARDGSREPILTAIFSSAARADSFRDAIEDGVDGFRFHAERAPVDHLFGRADLRSIAFRAAMKDIRRNRGID